MCGITWIYNLKNKDFISKRIIERMTSSITHRGPDDFGYYKDDDIALGNRRLSIIDLKTGKQPIFNEDKSMVIVFNGELYNYKEIRKV